VSAQQRPVLSREVSDIQQFVLHLDASFYSGLCCILRVCQQELLCRAWMCRLHETVLKLYDYFLLHLYLPDYRACTAPVRDRLQEFCATPDLVCLLHEPALQLEVHGIQEIFSVCFETSLFISVKVRNIEINRKIFFWFHVTNRRTTETYRVISDSRTLAKNLGVGDTGDKYTDGFFDDVEQFTANKHPLIIVKDGRLMKKVKSNIS
jgi:hypothetical protein